MQSTNGTPERWTPEMLDRLASTVATAIAASNERMTRFEDGLTRLEANQARSEERMGRLEANQTRFEQELAEFRKTVEADHEQANAERQALARDMAQMVATRQEDIARVQQVEAALIKLTDLSEGIALLLAKSDDNHPTVLAKLNRIENKVDRLLEGPS